MPSVGPYVTAGSLICEAALCASILCWGTLSLTSPLYSMCPLFTV